MEKTLIEQARDLLEQFLITEDPEGLDLQETTAFDFSFTFPAFIYEHIFELQAGDKTLADELDDLAYACAYLDTAPLDEGFIDEKELRRRACALIEHIDSRAAEQRGAAT